MTGAEHNRYIENALFTNPALIKDKAWRLEHLYFIITKAGTREVFKMNRAQRHFFDNYLNVPNPYHRHCILKSRQLGFCLDPETKVLTAELLWVPIKNLTVGQEIVSVDEKSVGGWRKGRKMRTAIVQKKAEVFRDAYKITFEDGRTVICTSKHPWLSRRKKIPEPMWRALNATEKENKILAKNVLKVGDEIRWITKPWGEQTVEDGWFGGILDGEGSMDKITATKSPGINASQLRGPVWDRMVKYANDNGYNYRIENDKTARLTKYGKHPVPKLCFGRMNEIFKLVGKTRPTRFISRRFWEGRELPGKRTGIGWEKIVSIEQLPDQTMIDLQTSTGTFIAEGFVSHNTTFIDLFILDEILFSPNKNGIIIAHKLDDAEKIFNKKIDYAIRNMSEEVKDAFFKINLASAKQIQVVIDYGPEAGSTSTITVSTSGRSGTYHLVHISEYAKMCMEYPKRASEVETGTFPAVPTLDGYIFIESTAEGPSGRFYEIFSEGWDKRDKITPTSSRAEFLPHFYNWQYDDMELDNITENIPVEEMEQCEIDWAAYQKEHNLTDKEITYYYLRWKQLGGKNGTDAIKKLHSEYPTTQEEAFLSTGQAYFPIAKVAALLKEAPAGERGELLLSDKGDPIFAPNTYSYLEIFFRPEPNHHYIIGGDTAEGLSHGDYQVLYVLDQKTEDCVAVYRSHVAPDELANEAYKLGKYYNWALLAIEVNKDGLWVNDALEKMGYINLYYRKSFDDITQKITKFFGWKTT